MHTPSLSPSFSKHTFLALLSTTATTTPTPKPTLPCTYCPHVISPRRHGLARSEQLIYADPKLSFLQSVPKSALFSDPDKVDDRLSGAYRTHLYLLPWRCVTMVTQSYLHVVAFHLYQCHSCADVNDIEERVPSDNAESSGWNQEKDAGVSSSSQSQGVPIGWPKVRTCHMTQN